MKKKSVCLTAALTAAVLLSGCGADKSYVSGINPGKYVTLGEYKGLEITEQEPEITEDYMNMYIEYMLSAQAGQVEVTDRAAQNGDTVNIDYEGRKDGVAFEGGTAQGTDLVLGSGSFIPGFEEGLVGAEIGETRDIKLTFPEDYQETSLAGQEAVFTVKVNGITESVAPELTDEYVKGLGLEECTTVQEYKDYVKKILYEDALNTYNSNVQMELLEAASANCVFKEPPKEMVDRYEKTLTNNMTAYAQAYNMDLEAYMANFGFTGDNYQEEIRNQAVTTANQYIMMRAIADKEGLTVTDEEADAEMQAGAEANGYASLEEYKKEVDGEGYKEFMLGQKVLDFLKENAVISEPEEGASGQ